MGVEALPGASYRGTLLSSTSSPYPNSVATTGNSAILRFGTRGLTACLKRNPDLFGRTVGLAMPRSCAKLPRGTLASLPQHPYEHRPERPVLLLAVDQEFGEGAARARYMAKTVAPRAASVGAPPAPAAARESP